MSDDPCRCPICKNRSGVPKRIYTDPLTAALKASEMQRAQIEPVLIYVCPYRFGLHLTRDRSAVGTEDQRATG